MSDQLYTCCCRCQMVQMLEAMMKSKDRSVGIYCFIACSVTKLLNVQRVTKSPKLITSFSSSIVEPQLKDLILVRTVKWYELGLQLEVEGKDLDVIQANNQNNIEACKREMFSKWLGITPNASYQQVVEALQIVGEISEADHLRKKIR